MAKKTPDGVAVAPSGQLCRRRGDNRRQMLRFLGPVSGGRTFSSASCFIRSSILFASTRAEVNPRNGKFRAIAASARPAAARRVARPRLLSVTVAREVSGTFRQHPRQMPDTPHPRKKRGALPRLVRPAVRRVETSASTLLLGSTLLLRSLLLFFLLLVLAATLVAHRPSSYLASTLVTRAILAPLSCHGKFRLAGACLGRQLAFRYRARRARTAFSPGQRPGVPWPLRGRSPERAPQAFPVPPFQGLIDALVVLPTQGVALGLSL